MSISRVGSATISGTSITLPAGRIVGDLEVMVAFNKSSGAPPTVPSDWTVIQTQLGFGCCAVAAYRYCFSTSDTSGTWTNATQLVAVVYRNAIAVGPSAASQQSSSLFINAFNHTGWSFFNGSGTTITDGLADPYGGTSAMSFPDDGTQNIHGFYYFGGFTKTASTQTDWQCSAVAKKGDGKGFGFYIEFGAATSRGGVLLDLSSTPSSATYSYGNASVVSSSFYNITGPWYFIEGRVRISATDTETQCNFVVCGTGGPAGVNDVTYTGTSGQVVVTAASATCNLPSTTLTYPALTMLGTNSRSWVVGVGASTAATNVNTAIPGSLANVASITASGAMVAVADTNGGVSSFSSSAQTVNASGGQIGMTFELADHTTFDRYRSAVLTKSGLYTFSTDQLTAAVNQSPAANGMRFMSRILATGKRVYKVTMASNAGSTTDGVGLANTNCTSGTALGATADSLLLNTSGQVMVNNINRGSTGVTWTSSDTLYIAVDIDNDKFWVKNGSGNWNNNASNNPDTGVGGISITALTNGNGFAPAVGVNSGQATEATGFVYDGTGGAHGLTTFIGWDGVTMIAPALGATNAETVGKSTTRVNIYSVSQGSLISRGSSISLRSIRALIGQYVTLGRPKTVKATGHGQSLSIKRDLGVSRSAVMASAAMMAKLIQKTPATVLAMVANLASRGLGEIVSVSHGQASANTSTVGVIRGASHGFLNALGMGYVKSLIVATAEAFGLVKTNVRFSGPSVTSPAVVGSVKSVSKTLPALAMGAAYGIFKAAGKRAGVAQAQTLAMGRNLVAKRAVTSPEAVRALKTVAKSFNLTLAQTGASFRQMLHIVRVNSVSLTSVSLTLIAAHLRTLATALLGVIGAKRGITTTKAVTSPEAVGSRRTAQKPFGLSSPSVVALRAQAAFFRALASILGQSVVSVRAAGHLSKLNSPNLAFAARSVVKFPAVLQAQSFRVVRSTAKILGLSLGFAFGLVSKRSIYTGHVAAGVGQAQAIKTIRTRAFSFRFTLAQSVNAWGAGILSNLEVIAKLVGRSTAAIIRGAAG